MKRSISRIKDILKEADILISDELMIPDEEIECLLTDSRSVANSEKTLFIAIKNPAGNDGNIYIEELYKKGVRNYITDSKEDFVKLVSSVNSSSKQTDNQTNYTGFNFLRVKDSVQALLALGKASHLPGIDYVAITGSRGKTTLKEWLFQLMEPLREISRSPRSYNSKIGVPLSMWQVDPSSQIALLEAGISKRGEMQILTECIDPKTVILINITDAHSEGFSSNIEKAREKAILASGKNVERIIYNADDPFISEAIRFYANAKESIGWSFSGKESDINISINNEKEDNVRYIWNGKEFSFPFKLADEKNKDILGAALTFMLSEGIDPEVIKERFSHLNPISTRLNVSEGMNGCSIIFDSYTSDFSSLKPAIDFMIRRKMPDQKTLLIMSDILHESSKDEEAYERISGIVKEHKIECFIGIGRNMCRYKSFFPEGSLFFENTEEFLKHLTASDFIDNIILLKGSPEFHFKRIHEMLEAKKHETVLEVNLDSIVSNYNYFRSHIPSGTGIIAMVKASGYGAGSYEIAKTLQDCGASYLAVAVLDEGIDLRRNGITMPIMVMNPKVANYKSMFANRLEPEIYSLDMLREVVREASRNRISDYPIHIKLDTGMHRMGLESSDLPLLIEILQNQNAVKVASVFSHLATADCLDMDDYTLLQLDRFKKETEYMASKLSYSFRRHILNSAGILRFPEYHYDMVRLGIGLYGANTLPIEIEKPLAVVSTLRTVIIAIKDRKKCETIGYGRKGNLKRDSRIATLPIGYADGMNRHFGNGNISVKINGKDAPTVGNICMDACMVDVTEIDCKVGDSVEIFGNEAPLQRLADTLDTIPYEILTSISPRVKRIYFRD